MTDWLESSESLQKLKIWHLSCQLQKDEFLWYFSIIFSRPKLLKFHKKTKKIMLQFLTNNKIIQLHIHIQYII